MRTKITLACTECKQRNYDTIKNKQNNSERIELQKYCKFCKKHTLHKETKQKSKEVRVMAKKQKSANRKKNIAKADASSDIRSKANRVARQRKKRGSFKEYFKGVR